MWRRVLFGGTFAVLLARAASADAQVYAQAACTVSRWTAGHDLRALIADLAVGGTFPRG